MAEYIEREAAIKFVKEQMEEVNNKTAINGSSVTKTYDMAIRHATKLLRYVPTAYPKADVVEVRHGEWVETQEPLGWCDVDCAECSVCHESWIIDEDSSIDDYKCMWNYCPHCGAKMDGKEVEGE